MASSNFINECKNGANANRLGKFTINNVNINQSEYLNSMTITDSIYNNGLILGGIFDRTLEATIVNKPSNLNLESQVVSNVAMGVVYADTTTEYVDFDNFIIEDIEDSETGSKTSFTAYGSGAKLDEPYNCTLDFSNDTSHTIYEFLEDVCDQLGLTPANQSITNGTIAITGNPFKNLESCRVVLEAIEKVSCSYAVIDWANQTLDLRWFSGSLAYEFNTSDYSTLKGSLTKYGPVNVVIIGNSQITGENVSEEDDESIAQNGETQIMIDEPYFLYTQTLREQALPAIFNKIDGFEYCDVELETPYGKPFLKVGDKIKINAPDGTIYNTYVLTHQVSFNGTFSSTIKSPALTNEQQKMKNNINSSSIQNRLKKTEIVVDKINGEITSTVARVDILEESIDALEVRPDTNLAVVTVDTSRKPFENKTYEIGYNVKFLGSAVATGYTITTLSQHTGITVSLATLGKIRFTVASSTAIPSEDNKYDFTVSYTIAGDTYTADMTVVVSTITNEAEQNVVVSNTEPTDTSVLWYDTTSYKLKSYIAELHTYQFTNDSIFIADKEYYELINDSYVQVAYDSTTQKYTLNGGTEYSVGDTMPPNTLYEHIDISAGWYEVNEDSNLQNYVDGIARSLSSTTSYLNGRIDGVAGDLGRTNTSLTALQGTVSNNYTYLNGELQRQGTEVTKISTIESSVKKLQTDTYDKTQIQSILDGEAFFVTKDKQYQAGTVYYNSNHEKMTAGTDYTIGADITGTVYEHGQVTTVVNNISVFDDEGLKIRRENGNNQIISETTGLYNDKGISIHAVANYVESDEVLYAGYVADSRFGAKYIGNTIVYTDNLKVNTYSELGTGVLIQDYTDPKTNRTGTGWFAL